MTQPPLPPVPSGVTRLLVAMAADPSLLERVLAGRSRAAEDAGHSLNDSERAIVDSVPAETLREMVQHVALASRPSPDRPEHALQAPGGHAPDVPRPTESSPTRGIRPGVGLIGAIGKLFKK